MLRQKHKTSNTTETVAAIVDNKSVKVTLYAVT